MFILDFGNREGDDTICFDNCKNDNGKRMSIDQYIKTHSITPEQFLEIFKAANFTDDNIKRASICQYMEKKSITPEQFLEIFKAANFTDDNIKRASICQYMEKKSITPEQFLEIFKAANFTDEDQKLNVIKSYFSNKKNQYFDNLLRILSSEQIGDLKYRVDLICDTLKICPYSTKQKAKNLSDLANELYPNIEHLRIELFKQAIDKNLINKDNIKYLKLDNIDSNDLLLDFLTYAQSKIQEIGELDILKLTKGRYHSRYESLADLLKDKKLEDVFSQDSMTQINGIFNNNIQELKVLDILSYFDAKGRVEDFHSMLQESFKQELINTFKPSKDQLLISEEELGKIAKLTGDESVKDQFFKVGDLCQYIKDKVGELPELKENFKINFHNIQYINPETQEKIQEASQKAFKSDAEPSDIIGFLKLIIDTNGADNLVITELHPFVRPLFFKKS